MTELIFKLERRIRLPGQDWGEYRLEAECRHWQDMAVLMKRVQDRAGVMNPVDCTGRKVQAEYKASGASGELKSFIVGV